MFDTTRWEGRRQTTAFLDGRCYIERKVRYVGWFGFVKERTERIEVPEHPDLIAHLLNRDNMAVAIRFSFRDLELALAAKEVEYETGGYKMPERLYARKAKK